MFRISAGEYFFMLSSVVGDGEATDFDLSIHDDPNDTLKIWRGSSRISPAWQLSCASGQKVSYDYSGTKDILFLSAISPGRLYGLLQHSTAAKLARGQLWLTIGVYNIIVLSSYDDLTHEIIDICQTNRISCEQWYVASADINGKFTIQGMNFFDPPSLEVETETAEESNTQSSKAIEAISQNAFHGKTRDVDYSILELKTLMAVAKGRSRTNFPELAKDCVEIVRTVELCLQDESQSGEEAGPQRLDMLLSLNAGLSRLASQAFSGTTPISRTECHFWPHSFLGIGVANVALRNIASFITDIVKLTKYQPRYTKLLEKSSGEFVKDVLDAIEAERDPSTANPFFRLPCALDNVILPPECEPSDSFAPTPITYYSGRDGFRNNLLTTSAPLLSVSGCNSVQWNLGTITHELSHRVVAGKLQDAYQEILGWAEEASRSDRATLELSKARLCVLPYCSHDKTDIKNINGVVVYLLAKTLLCFHSLEYDKKEWDKMTIASLLDFYENAWNTYSEEIEELMVHLFDFYHFYGMDADIYVSYVWRSWAVQPTIMQKLEPYVKRTFVALAAKYYSYPDWIDRTFIEVRRIFSKDHGPKKVPFIDDVNQIITENEEELRSYLEITKHLIGLFLAVFRSDGLQYAAANEPLRNPGRSSRQKNYSVPHLYFHSGRESISQPILANPLIFVRDYSQHEFPNSAQSAWVLHFLAFHYTGGEKGYS